MDEDDDMALPNDAEDMHKILHQRREELKQIKEQRVSLTKNNATQLRKSENSEHNLA